MSDTELAEYIETAVLAINEDDELRDAFQKFLSFSPNDQQVRVTKLLDFLESKDAPKELKAFVRLLRDENLARKVLESIS